VQRHTDASRSYLLVFLQKLLQEAPFGSDSIYYSFDPRLISLLPHGQKRKQRFGKPTGPDW
jgi:hypothetical protein